MRKINWLNKYKIAHRGLHNKLYPENSMPAFENAILSNCAIELDIQLLRDGTIVVFHDTNLKRMCGVDIPLFSLTAEDLPNYKLNGTEYTIPTLQEVLDWVDNKVPLIIEIKAQPKEVEIEARSYAILKHYKGDYAIKSFDPRILIWYKKFAPKVYRGMLSSDFKNIYMSPIKKFILRRLWFFKSVDPDFISYDVQALPNKYVDRHRVPLLAWVIRNPKSEKEALKIADNIIFEGYIPKEPIIYKK